MRAFPSTWRSVPSATVIFALAAKSVDDVALRNAGDARLDVALGGVLDLLGELFRAAGVVRVAAPNVEAFGVLALDLVKQLEAPNRAAFRDIRE